MENVKIFKTEKEKMDYFIERGWTYDKETGNVFSHTGRLCITKNKKGYIQCAIKIPKANKTIHVMSHRFAWYVIFNEIPDQIDHIDQNKTNNKIENLRNVSNMFNCWNRDYYGISFHKRIKKWQVRIGVNNKRIHIGYFEDENIARSKYLEAKKKYHVINGSCCKTT